MGSVSLSRSVGPDLECWSGELEDLSERLEDGMPREYEDIVVVQHVEAWPSCLGLERASKNVGIVSRALRRLGAFSLLLAP